MTYEEFNQKRNELIAKLALLTIEINEQGKFHVFLT